MSAIPLVSVVMPVYNGEKHLEEAVESILNQTFSDFEFIIIDDGSTDGTSDILARYQQIDSRVHVYQQQNQGLIASLNRGCQLAQGKYIARMDADDVSLPGRLAKQVEYMEEHPKIGVLGTWMETIDENGVSLGKTCMPTSPSVIRWCLMFRDCLVHPSTFMRRDIVERLGFYHYDALHVEDYDMWARASMITDIANVPDALVKYRVSDTGICSRYGDTQEANSIKVMQWMTTQLLGREVPLELVAGLSRLHMGQSLASLRQIELVDRLVQQLHRAYLETRSLDRVEQQEVAQDAAAILLTLAASASKVSLWKGLVIFMRAVQLNPRLLFSRQIITKGTRTLAGRLRFS